MFHPRRSTGACHDESKPNLLYTPDAASSWLPQLQLAMVTSQSISVQQKHAQWQAVRDLPHAGKSPATESEPEAPQLPYGSESASKIFPAARRLRALPRLTGAHPEISRSLLIDRLS